MSRKNAPAIGAGTVLKFLPEAIRTPQNALRAIAVGWLTAFPASMVFAAIGAFLIPQAQQPQFNVSGAAAIFALVIFSPVVETLIMGGLLLILLRLMPPWLAVIASAVGWGIAHSSVAPIWGLVIWWPFLVLSTLFVAWRQRSLGLAFLLPMVAHGLHNLPTALLVANGINV